MPATTRLSPVQLARLHMIADECAASRDGRTGVRYTTTVAALERKGLIITKDNTTGGPDPWCRMTAAGLRRVGPAPVSATPAPVQETAPAVEAAPAPVDVQAERAPAVVISAEVERDNTTYTFVRVAARVAHRWTLCQLVYRFESAGHRRRAASFADRIGRGYASASDAIKALESALDILHTGRCSLRQGGELSFCAAMLALTGGGEYTLPGGGVLTADADEDSDSDDAAPVDASPAPVITTHTHRGAPLSESALRPVFGATKSHRSDRILALLPRYAGRPGLHVLIDAPALGLHRAPGVLVQRTDRAVDDETWTWTPGAAV